MPHAIDRSLATPMIRPRLPAMMGPGLAISKSVIGCLVFSPKVRPRTSNQPAPRLYTFIALNGPPLRSPGGGQESFGQSGIMPAEDKSGIGAAETEAVRHDTVKL